MPRSYPFEGGFTGEDFRYLGKSDISCTFPSLTNLGTNELKQNATD
jgi:hypothetical protein